MKDSIIIKGARVNNLKNVDVEFPRNKFVVVTGLSGSGKSSLAFDTLYAEGQRRYVESLSSYARQFMGKMEKPDVDFIRGLPPAIAIEQKVNTRNPRSTVGTSTEIYDYLRLLFSRVGHTYSPVSGLEVKKHNVEDVVRYLLGFKEGTRMAISVGINLPEGRSIETQMKIFLSEGYSRLLDSDDRFVEIETLDKTALKGKKADDYRLLIDRLAIKYEGDDLSRLRESLETAFFEGHDSLRVTVWDENGDVVSRDFSRRFEADGITFLEPTEMLFNFNNPYGACPVCDGFGKIMGIDPNLVIPNEALSVYEGAVACWKGEKMSQWKENFIAGAARYKFPVHRPYLKLTEEEKDILWKGRPGLEGIDDFFRMLEQNRHKIQYNVMLARYRGKTICPECHGTLLRREAQYVKINGKTITELVSLPVDDLLDWFGNIELDETDSRIAKRILKEIISRLTFLREVGLGYLTLSRPSNTLSGGESQRINLATSLGSSLVGSIYILDEPSIGLHPRDTQRLISVLKGLRDVGNSVVVVEHDEEIMRASDWIIDVGPLAGENGGKIIYQGPTEKIISSADSLTADYLTGKRTIPYSPRRRKSSSYIELKGVLENNLKNIDVRFPLGVMTVVTGVSGSGKSTLVRDVLYRSLLRYLGEPGEAPGAHLGIGGDLSRISSVEFIDQNPIGKSTRSNPATYLKAYDEIRALFAEQQASVQMGFTPASFSFNAEGGRCEECKGDGYITVEMQFMADIKILCDECGGKRFKKDILDISYRGKNIYDVLEMTVSEAIEFFSGGKGVREKRIVRRLQPLSDVGLGYIRLGQSSSTLSGGENQRVKLAYFLSLENSGGKVFIFDEPTTGLHLHDISQLLDSLNRLIASGNTVIVIEHNMEVVKTADYVIDIGPEGGEKGGNIVIAGTPEQVAACDESYTGKALKGLLNN